MQQHYEHAGRPLTTSIALYLIKTHFAETQSIRYQDLRKKVDALHLELGGRKYAGKSHHPVRSALTKLHKRGHAKNIELGRWQICIPSRRSANEVNEYDSDGVRTVGSGESEVYVYYYPRYQEAAQLKGESIFECKIGKTEDDSTRRIHSQTGTGMPEEPQKGLVIKTDTPSKVEQCLHGILKAIGRHKEDAPGKEWFRTNPDEVEGIFRALDSFNKAV